MERMAYQVEMEPGALGVRVKICYSGCWNTRNFYLEK